MPNKNRQIIFSKNSQIIFGGFLSHFSVFVGVRDYQVNKIYLGYRSPTNADGEFSGLIMWLLSAETL